MTRSRLLVAGLLHYWRTNLAVLLGVVAGTAVIGGALAVGDSVRDSLRAMSLVRLGDVDHALQGQRFFREALADEIARQPTWSERFAAIAPALVMQGSLDRRDAATGEMSRAGRVNVYGVDARLWQLIDRGDVAPPSGNEAILNARTAEALGVAPGDEITLRVELPETVPRESLFGERDATSQAISLAVREILPDELGAARFGLDPQQQIPLLAFVPLATLQEKLDLSEERIRIPEERRIEIVPARVNALFAQSRRAGGVSPPVGPPVDAASSRGTDSEDGPAIDRRAGRLSPAAPPSGEAIGPETAAALNELLRRTWRLEDLGLRLRAHDEQGYLSLESDRMVLEDSLAAAGKRAAAKRGLAEQPVLVYLANEIAPEEVTSDELRVTREEGSEDPSLVTRHSSRVTSTTDNGQRTNRYSMYSIVAGVELPFASPFGEFEYVGDPPAFPLDSRDIILNDWLAADLRVSPVDKITLTYNRVGAHAEIVEDVATFTVRGIVKLAGPADDRGLTPEVRGVTDVEDYADWDQPFPMKLGRVTPRDDEYWEERRATPKAFVSLDTARDLWGSRFGGQTSLRIALPTGKTTTEFRKEFADELLATINPQTVGLAFQPVKFRGLEAASGTTDFAGLFIGFSFFLILAATILIVLLFRLGVERRAAQVGLLSAIGFTQAQVRRMYFTEGLLVVCVGGLIGTAAAVGYAALMVHGLRTWWIGAIGTRFLFVSVHWQSLAIGFAISVGVAAIAIWWALRQLRKIAPRDLLAGATEPPLAAGAQRRRGRRAGWIGITCAAIAAALLIGVLTGAILNVEAFAGFSWQVVAFFLVGTLLLAASLSFLSAWLDADRALAVRGRGIAGLGRLGMRNTARHRQRSVFTVGLIAAATFVIVAVAAGRRNPIEERPDRDSGNGGFRLVAESSVPILHDPNTATGREELGIRPAPGSEAARLLDAMRIVPFRMKPGEDASCLNIYRTQLPTILGVPQRMIDRGGFEFADTRAAEPWRLLLNQRSEVRGQRSEEKVTSGELRGGVTSDELRVTREESSPDPSLVTRHSSLVTPIPVLGDANTLQYSLHKGIGDTIAVPNEESPDYVLEIVGMFDGSVFQGVLLMSEENFQRLYPEQSGYRYFLIGDEPGDGSLLSQADAAELGRLLETELAGYGFDAEPVVERLAAFLAVQNTYLSTFQTLGGLGLLLGTFGLATVMLRNVLERRGELALLRAVGFRNAGLGVLVLWENAFLLAWGLLAGTVSAMLAMAPHLRSTGADVPWLGGAAILAAVFAVGMAAALFAVREAVRTPILATLRSE